MAASIYDHSPWLVSDDRFSTVQDQKVIQSLLVEARDHHTFLTLCDNDRNLHFKSVLIRVNDSTFQIDKPIEWNGKSRQFEIFFQDSSTCWNMIRTEFVEEGLYALIVAKPDKVYRLQNRRASRVQTVSDATASFIAGKGSLTDLQIMNLSRSGMLVCGILRQEALPLDSIIKDITITLPENFNILSARINQGKIVRAFQRTDSEETCHAISFNRDESPILEINGFMPKD